MAPAIATDGFGGSSSKADVFGSSSKAYRSSNIRVDGFSNSRADGFGNSRVDGFSNSRGDGFDSKLRQQQQQRKLRR
ncbi:hypothetical protein SLEP1_g8993 [Rubroshorea leprosula]|uniref:Uncharacterized protein n=1 Tax=Rubroshorea leprosula TaxID=152421 RepID=A0AAV5I3J0_9ROSI|nr:hypothetical protein SLEP1_g8993 [Rubroshorea leprosula]